MIAFPHPLRGLVSAPRRRASSGETVNFSGSFFQGGNHAGTFALILWRLLLHLNVEVGVLPFPLWPLDQITRAVRPGDLPAIAIKVGLDLKLPSPELFTMFVILALLTTAMCGPLLRWWLPKDFPALVPM